MNFWQPLWTPYYHSLRNMKMHGIVCINVKIYLSMTSRKLHYPPHLDVSHSKHLVPTKLPKIPKSTRRISRHSAITPRDPTFSHFQSHFLSPQCQECAICCDSYACRQVSIESACFQTGNSCKRLSHSARAKHAVPPAQFKMRSAHFLQTGLVCFVRTKHF